MDRIQLDPFFPLGAHTMLWEQPSCYEQLTISAFYLHNGTVTILYVYYIRGKQIFIVHRQTLILVVIGSHSALIVILRDSIPLVEIVHITNNKLSK